MIAICDHSSCKKSGKNRNGSQRYQCLDCGKKFSDAAPVKPLRNMRIDIDTAANVLRMLLEGMSVRATERITGVNRDTICDLILVAGERCQAFTEQHIASVQVDDVQIDEIWSFVGMKAKTAKTNEAEPEFGDSWTYIALERNTKLVLAHHCDLRNSVATDVFLCKVRRAVDTSKEFQCTTDGFQSYRTAVPFALGGKVSFAQLIKHYAATQEQTRYSPAQITGIEKIVQFGNPEIDKISTSHVERFNLSLRMHLRRFTRLTNAHSKRLAHHISMQNIFIAYYNFCRKHEALKTTPAVASGLMDRALTIQQLLSS